jgi:hypothetical protein
MNLREGIRRVQLKRDCRTGSRYVDSCILCVGFGSKRLASSQTLREMVSNIDNAGIRLDGQLSRQETNMNTGLERLDESVKQALALKDDFWFDVHTRWEAILGDFQGGLNAVIKETGERSLDELNIELHHALGAVSQPRFGQKC